MTGSTHEFIVQCRSTEYICADTDITAIAGAGISMNSYWSVHREIADGSLVMVLPDYKVLDETALWLVYPKSNVLTAKVRIFIDFLLEKMGNSPIWVEPVSTPIKIQK